MARVYVSIGSNQDAADNVRRCVDALRAEFGALDCSPVYVNPAVGFAGDDFLNLVVGFDTARDIPSLKSWLRAREDAQGRVRGADRFAPRTLDLDLIAYGDEIHADPPAVLPHPDILKYAFVLKPLADLAPHAYHPLARETYATLWARRAADSPPLTEWRGFFEGHPQSTPEAQS